jgi:hypothetical protein
MAKDLIIGQRLIGHGRKKQAVRPGFPGVSREVLDNIGRESADTDDKRCPSRHAIYGGPEGPLALFRCQVGVSTGAAEQSDGIRSRSHDPLEEPLQKLGFQLPLVINGREREGREAGEQGHVNISFKSVT